MYADVAIADSPLVIQSMNAGTVMVPATHSTAGNPNILVPTTATKKSPKLSHAEAVSEFGPAKIGQNALGIAARA